MLPAPTRYWQLHYPSCSICDDDAGCQNHAWSVHDSSPLARSKV